MCRIAARYGKWPHEVAALPFHYFLALREEWISANTVQPPGDDETDGDVEISAKSFTG